MLGKVFFLLIITSWAFHTAIGIKLESVSVPEYAFKDGNVTMRCDFDLENDTLLSVKWYKGVFEFFRFGKNLGYESLPNMLTFPMPGVNVDLTLSGKNQIVLKDITLRSSGTYTCEVSAEAPSFRTLSEQGTMVVIAPPPSPPEITGIHPLISVGQMLRGNCTSRFSQPPAKLMLYINEEKAEPSELIEYSPMAEYNGLETSTMGFSFEVNPRHFRKGIMELKCSATIGNAYSVSKLLFTISETTISAQPSIPETGRNPPLPDVSSGSGSIFARTRGIQIKLFIAFTILYTRIISLDKV